ncbi:MAG: hypothetical protein EZS28_049816, partial [Streblomastix strix]
VELEQSNFIDSRLQLEGINVD